MAAMVDLEQVILTDTEFDQSSGQLINQKIGFKTIIDYLIVMITEGKPKRILFLNESISVPEKVLMNLGIFDLIDVEHSSFDLSCNFPIEDDTYDMIIGLDSIGTVSGENVDENEKRLIYECSRVLTPDGKILFTVENSGSIKAIIRSIAQCRNATVRGRSRHFTPEEFEYLLVTNGISIVKLDTFDYGFFFNVDYQKTYEVKPMLVEGYIEKLLEGSPFTEELRGDTIMVEGKKTNFKLTF